ncbi:MAG TPA: dienelactone hydrolase family protein, partial [Luteolibacter sp.]|nr:dienelactone hydrolase family protein [Luteolibacter sp.]
MMKRLLLLSALLISATHAALVEETVNYEQGGVTLEGFRVYDNATTDKRPAVLIIHQWTGLTTYEKGRARQLAELGYNVLAADIYGQGNRPVPPEAAKEAGKYKTARKP